ncbi:hypothetical protein GCM10009559_67730 [Pseudonocardia zijingensis]|uniref:Uncharacterized protein n=1 Tax=Pseudonocardia zijingensis TaxID=153376 RepID=A0ABP3YTI1_9PSEU
MLPAPAIENATEDEPLQMGVKVRFGFFDSDNCMGDVGRLQSAFKAQLKKGEVQDVERAEARGRERPFGLAVNEYPHCSDQADRVLGCNG